MSNIMRVLSFFRVRRVRCFRSSDGKDYINHGESSLNQQKFFLQKKTPLDAILLLHERLYSEKCLSFSRRPGTDGHFHPIKVSQSSGYFLEIQASHHISKTETATGMDQLLSTERSVNTV